MRTLGVSGLGLIYTLEPLVADELARGRLQVVLDAYLPSVPGLFLYFPKHAQISPTFRAFVDFVRATVEPARPSPKRRTKL
jgi:DNA-binding transcriptional LysR family regulator